MGTTAHSGLHCRRLFFVIFFQRKKTELNQSELKKRSFPLFLRAEVTSSSDLESQPLKFLLKSQLLMPFWGQVPADHVSKVLCL
jgi:hypothetical protein